jgi:hypothetical protein
MRAIVWTLAATVLIPGLVACGDECDGRLDVELPAGQAEGTYVFSGTADGREFRCEYGVTIEGGEVVTATDRGCDGDASLVIRHQTFDVGVAASVTGVLSPPPDRLVYRVELFPFGAAEGQVEAEGTAEPDYGGGCRQAAIDVY